MKKNPLVSIITACYNSEEFIKDTVESVFNQTYGRIEYIIVDGGSTDGTMDIIKEYEARYSDQLRWISEGDEGVFHAMNKGIELSNGTIIGILNSDDWYEPETIETVVNEMTEDDSLDIVHGLLRDIEDDKIFKVEGVSSDFLETKMIKHPTCFVRKRAYERCGKFDLNYKLCADYELMLRFKQNNLKFKMLEKVLANYRLGGLTFRKRNSSYFEEKDIQHKYNVISFKRKIIDKIGFKIKSLLKKIY